MILYQYVLENKISNAPGDRVKMLQARESIDVDWRNVYSTMEQTKPGWI